MQKSYYNNAITGNSSMLATFSERAELLRLFWPNIDYMQQFDKFLIGIYIKNSSGSTVWLNDHRCEHQQDYVSDTNIVKNIITNHFDGYRVIVYDFVHPDIDVLVRKCEVENLSSESRELGFVLFSAAVVSDSDVSSTMFDFNNEALLHYKYDNYISISTDLPVCGFQIGNNSYDSAISTYLFGKDDIGMMKDAAVSWDLGSFSKNESKDLSLFICAADNLKECKRLTKECRNYGAAKLFNTTQRYWREYINNSRQIKTGNSLLDNLYKRSLLVFKLMYDKNTGGVMAAPEVDEYFTKCGRYAYCWGRDAAFITEALDKAGLTECVNHFYSWAVKVQEEDGSWQQRYHMNGNLAPCWGLQIDETGTILWGMLKHYRNTNDIEFLQSVWESVRAGADFLNGFFDQVTGLPKPSFDLWEERLGEHAYSSAAVYGGLKSAAEVAEILGKQDGKSLEWSASADRLKQSILNCFWKKDYNRFIRSVRVKLNGWGQEPSQNTVLMEVNPKGYVRDFSLEDWIVDVSLVGLSVPFEVLPADDDKMRSTVALIEQTLTSQGIGGIKRYENDSYIGGNPWILTTLWVALYYAKTGNYNKAKEYLFWSANCKTELGFLPEQVNKDSGKPDWVIPLTWSHAMYVQVLSELVDAGVL